MLGDVRQPDLRVLRCLHLDGTFVALLHTLEEDGDRRLVDNVKSRASENDTHRGFDVRQRLVHTANKFVLDEKNEGKRAC